MVSSAAPTVEAYLAELPPARRAVIATVRDMVNRHLPAGYVEAMAWGMIGWGIPLARYPDTYNKQPLCYVALAAQKNNYALYLMNVYADSGEEQSLRAAYARAGKKLDMGKCCLRFKSLDGLLMDEVGRLVAGTSVEQYIARYEASRALSADRAAAKKTGSGAVAVAKKSSPAKTKVSTAAAAKAEPAQVGRRAAGPAKAKTTKPAAKPVKNATKKIARKAVKKAAEKVQGRIAKATVKTAVGGK